MSTRSRIREYLVDQQLSAVCFVMDYVEFCFDGPILRALTGPVISDGGQHATFPDPGSRDALCSIIGDVVEDVQVNEERDLRVLFRSGRTVVVPVDLDSRSGPEAAHFVVPKDNVMEVW